MATENGTLWEVLKELLQEEGNALGVGADSLATQAARKDPSLLGEGESWTAFLERVRKLLIAKGLLDGESPGATVKALTTPELRKAAGLSLGTSPTECELASMTLLGSRPSGNPAGMRPAKPVPAAPTALSLDLEWAQRCAATAAERDEEEKLAKLLLGR